MNRQQFFAAVRTSVFGGTLAQNQVDGMNAILDGCAALQVSDQRDIAYILATPMIETGGTYVPKSENLNYSVEALTSKFGKRISAQDAQRFGRKTGQVADQQAIANAIYGGAWGAKMLGNTEPGDGWNFRGRGLAQVTGRGNYKRFETLLGIPFTANPSLMGVLDDAAKVMIIGMRDGIFTGRKLRDYFTAKSSDWNGARQTVNGLDRAGDIAAFAKLFSRALQVAA
jgi:putative chitinase